MEADLTKWLVYGSRHFGEMKWWDWEGFGNVTDEMVLHLRCPGKQPSYISTVVLLRQPLPSPTISFRRNEMVGLEVYGL
jgi:hypothetical protein